MSGIDHNKYMPIKFKVTVNRQEEWEELEDLEVISDGEAVIGSDSYITMDSSQHVIRLNFKPVAVTAIRLDVAKADVGNIILTEIYLCNTEGRKFQIQGLNFVPD